MRYTNLYARILKKIREELCIDAYFLRYTQIYSLTLSAPALFFGQAQKFFFRKFIASFIFMLERYIERTFFRKDFELFFYIYMSEKTEKSSQK